MKTTKPRKPRSDSVSEAVRIGTKVSLDVRHVDWPACVPPALAESARELELTVFDATIMSREVERWTPVEKVTVARLAGHIAMQIADENTLKRTGTLMRSPNSDKHFLRNPLLDAISTRQAIINQLCRQIGISLPAVDFGAFALNRARQNASNADADDAIMSLLAQ